VIAGVSGRLISTSFATTGLPELSGIREAPAHVQRAALRWHAARDAMLGPASSVRTIRDAAVTPLLQLLGFRVIVRNETGGRSDLLAQASRVTVPVTVLPWSHSLDAAWRTTIHSGITVDGRWCLCTNGRALRLVDAHRTWARQHLEFDLDLIPDDQDSLTLLWTLLRAEALDGPEPLLDRAIAASARHGHEVCRALGDGVLDALARVIESLAASAPQHSPEVLSELLDQSLTVLYRVLFLLFAEARGLVPIWHPIYRDRYTIDSLVSTLLGGRRCRGMWQALQAISRLAHAGCRAGDLRVTAFNGRLFSPLHTPSATRGRIDDDTMGRALLAVSTTSETGSGRTRIAYRDLDVEQLGAVYEHVLDYEASRESSRVALRRTGDARKASGTFYTPRSVTSYLVRRALAPLVQERTCADILNLRIVDPAMGSGAFLVAACRYLAAAAEAALVRDGEWQASDVTAADRIALRRDVAQRCLFGIDLNPMAVQLARLSLWLATLAADKPLTFLDHHLVAGDSLTGASFEQVAARPPGGGRSPRHAELPLFDEGALAALVRDIVPARLSLSFERDDDVEVVRRKESALAALRSGAAGKKWKSLLDLWCACWFWNDGPRPTPAVFHDLCDALWHGQSALPSHVAASWHERAESIARARRFLHWELEFPEVFFDEQGRPRSNAGFDAVIGNPPWDMVRGDCGEGAMRDARRADARQLLDFVRGAGIYAVDARSHVNRYHLFVERALRIVKPGGRVGLVLPAGVVSDTGSAPLRRRLFDTSAVDTVVGFDNRQGIFPIHRSVRFVLLTATPGRPTDRVACRFGVSDAETLDSIDDHTCTPDAFPVTTSRAFLARVSGVDDLGIPELATAIDLRIVEKISATHPWLSAGEGWDARFGRELNASDDRHAFRRSTGTAGVRPVLEGKQIAPFRVAIDSCTLELRPGVVQATRVPRRPRLAYRDVASATNRLTLIAAIIPARAVTTHTLFCLRTPVPYERQMVLCALLNSFVANYLVRLRVHTHVTASIMARLPVPSVPEGDPVETRLRDLTQRLCAGTTPVEEMREYIELQALVGRLYGLSREEFVHVVGTFPLIPIPIREAVLARFDDIH
jgi:hypothetical protein